ncbi:MAG: LURP-one-related family protein [Agathobacter sp.]|nr:LURP-one-related family protein [Agathobacter sp.]
MKLLIKQRVFSWGDKFDIYDEAGNVKYFVKGEVFSFGHQLHVYDMQDNEIGSVHEKIFSFPKKFEIVMNGATRGTITKQFTLFFQKYDIDFNGWHVDGDFLDWNYDVYAGGRPIIHINKEWLAWGDTYTIDFENPTDELMGLMLVVAIDAANCDHGDGGVTINM